MYAAELIGLHKIIEVEKQKTCYQYAARGWTVQFERDGNSEIMHVVDSMDSTESRRYTDLQYENWAY